MQYFKYKNLKSLRSISLWTRATILGTLCVWWSFTNPWQHVCVHVHLSFSKANRQWFRGQISYRPQVRREVDQIPGRRESSLSSRPDPSGNSLLQQILGLCSTSRLRGVHVADRYVETSSQSYFSNFHRYQAWVFLQIKHIKNHW